MVEFTYQPNWLWFAAGSVFLAALIGWFYFSARGAAGLTLRLALFGLRLLTLATVVVCLLDPERVTPIRHYQPAHIAVLVDTSRSMGLDEGGLTRLDLARNWIKNELKVPANFGVAYYGFSTNLYPLDNLAAAVPDGDRTAFAESLESLSAATRARSAGQHRAVVGWRGQLIAKPGGRRPGVRGEKNPHPHRRAGRHK